jgi:hydroxyacylglutathione hydrolase
MIVKRFYDDKLAQASYLIGCAATGEALVVDPNRDVEQYVAAAEGEELRITHVTETHIHADFVSGSRELAHRTGARLYLSDEGGEGWRYDYAEEAGAVLLKDGDGFQVGNVRIRAVHTPGHTPEHLSFLVTDGAASDEPVAALTGDFVFVGDVGRPRRRQRVRLGHRLGPAIDDRLREAHQLGVRVRGRGGLRPCGPRRSAGAAEVLRGDEAHQPGRTADPG